MEKVLFCVLCSVIVSCNALDKKGSSVKVLSPSFKANGAIAKKYTCEGENVSPALQWQSDVQGIKSYVLICDDPDAPNKTWVHWIVYNLPSAVTMLKEGVSIADLGGKEGVNDFGKTNYGGPCPPKGHGTHHYHFKVYALNKELAPKEPVTKEGLLASMQGHIMAEGELIGTYERS